MTRKQALQLGVAAAMPLLAGCGSSKSGAGAKRAAAGSISSEPTRPLRVFEWQGYDYPSFSAIAPYVKKYGKPTYTYITSPSEMITKMRTGFHVDVSHPGSKYIPGMVAFDLIQPWDMSLLEQAPNLDRSLLEHGQFQGQQYMIPFDIGPDTMLYRTDKIGAEEADSYGLLYDKRYKGRISWQDDPTDNLIAWGLYQGVDDPVNMTDAELADAKKFLIDAKKLVRNLWKLQADVESDLAAGNVWVAMGFGASYPPLVKKKVPIGLAWPKEGRLVYIVGYTLSKDTDMPRHAHEYVNRMVSPGGCVELTNSFGYEGSNLKVDVNEINPAIVKAFGLGDPTAMKRPKAYVVNAQRADRLQAYDKCWSEIRAA